MKMELIIQTISPRNEEGLKSSLPVRSKDKYVLVHQKPFHEIVKRQLNGPVEVDTECGRNRNGMPYPDVDCVCTLALGSPIPIVVLSQTNCI